MWPAAWPAGVARGLAGDDHGVDRVGGVHRGQRCPAGDQVGGPLGDRDRGRVGVPPRQGRHHRRVDHPQPGHAADPELGVEHAVPARVTAHRARADRVIQGHHAVPDVLEELGVGSHVRAGRQLAGADLGHRPGRHELPDQLQPRGQRPAVSLVGQVAGVDGRAVPRVGAAQPDPAPAGHVDQADQHRHRAPGRVGQALVLVRRREHVQLQVRGWQPGLGVSEAARFRHVAGQRAAVGQLPADQVRLVGLLPQAADLWRRPDNGQHRVVDEVAADPAEVGVDVNPHFDQVLGRADAGQHQQLRAVDRAAGQDDLGVGRGGLRLAVVQVAHPGRLAALHDHLRDQGVGVDGEVRPGHGGVQVRGGGRAALAVSLR